MRKLTGAVFQSLDGVMQAPGGPEEDPTSNFKYGGWSFHFWDESLEKPFGEIIDADYDLLLGRRTYDIFSAYWPNNQEMEIGARFHEAIAPKVEDNPRIREVASRVAGNLTGLDAARAIHRHVAARICDLDASNGEIGCAPLASV